MKTKPLRWGLLSTARINNAVIPGIRSSTSSELFGVASRSLERAEAYAQEKSIPHAYGSYTELINDPNIDVIYNSLPNHLHALWTIKAASAGKHVLCEKPLALSQTEVKEIQIAAEKNNVIISEAFMYRSHPRTQIVMEIIAQGTLGEIQYLRGSFTANLTNSDDIRWLPEFGGGCLWDLGCYPVSYAMMIANSQPRSVFGEKIMASSGVDIFFAGQISFENGVFAQFDCGFNSPYQTVFEIRGSKSTLIMKYPFTTRNNSSPIFLRQQDQESQIPFVDIDGYNAQVENFNRSILSGSPPPISLEESAKINNILVSLHSSAQKSRTVLLD